jgi:uncharacterized protein
MKIDVEAISAIDMHTHAQIPLCGEPDPRTMEILDAAAKHFRSEFPRPNVQQVADYYRARSMAAVVFCVDSQHNTGEVPVSNDEILEVAAANGDVLIPFVSVDPHRDNVSAPAHRERGAGFQISPQPAGILPERSVRVSALRSDRRGGPAGPLSHRALGDGVGAAWGWGDPSEVLQSDVCG